jgi:hypothetical protein
MHTPHGVGFLVADANLQFVLRQHFFVGLVGGGRSSDAPRSLLMIATTAASSQVDENLLPGLYFRFDGARRHIAIVELYSPLL